MKYNTGTVNVTNGSPTVTGDGSQKFLTNLIAGQLFTILNSGVSYEIGAVTDDNEFELVANYAGADAEDQLYTVVQSFTSNFDIPYTEPGDVQTATIFKRAMTLIDELLMPVTATTAQLTSLISDVNTLHKRAGRSVLNTTTHKVVTAAGPDADDHWYDAAGADTHTPV